MGPSTRCRCGLTAPEILIVVLLIATLMALILPSLAQVRSAAARITCASRMRQIGLAIHLYERHYKGMPFGNRNTIRALAPLLGQVSTETDTQAVRSLFRCPSDSYMLAESLEVGISYTPTENDTAPDDLVFCPWSTSYGEKQVFRSLESAGSDTVLMVEYWHPANRAMLASDTPGWVRTSMDWYGAYCPETIPTTPGHDVGGYNFLRVFDEEAQRVGRSRPLGRILHRGLINLVAVDGHVAAHRIADITDDSPCYVPMWTKAMD